MHCCTAPDCERPIQDRFLMCPAHWKRVPPDLQKRVYRTWLRLTRDPYPNDAKEAEYEAARAAAIASLSPNPKEPTDGTQSQA